MFCLLSERPNYYWRPIKKRVWPTFRRQNIILHVFIRSASPSQGYTRTQFVDWDDIYWTVCLFNSGRIQNGNKLQTSTVHYGGRIQSSLSDTVCSITELSATYYVLQKCHVKSCNLDSITWKRRRAKMKATDNYIHYRLICRLFPQFIQKRQKMPIPVSQSPKQISCFVQPTPKDIQFAIIQNRKNIKSFHLSSKNK